jgi:type IV pilus assembly protein PilF
MKKHMYLITKLVILSSLLVGCASVQTQDQTMASDDNVQLGLAYLQQHDTVHAREKLLMALQEAPHWSVAEDAMGYLNEVTGDEKEAEKFYLDALKNAPDDGAALNNYGVFLCRKHRASEAEKMFLKATKNPNYLNVGQAYENAALCELSVANRKKARDYFEKALKEEPERKLSQDELKKLND